MNKERALIFAGPFSDADFDELAAHLREIDEHHKAFAGHDVTYKLFILSGEAEKMKDVKQWMGEHFPRGWEKAEPFIIMAESQTEAGNLPTLVQRVFDIGQQILKLIALVREERPCSEADDAESALRALSSPAAYTRMLERHLRKLIDHIRAERPAAEADEAEAVLKRGKLDAET